MLHVRRSGVSAERVTVQCATVRLNPNTRRNQRSAATIRLLLRGGAPQMQMGLA